MGRAHSSRTDVAAILTALDSFAGLPCSILSNSTPNLLHSVVRSVGFDDRFQYILSVDEVRTYKPSPIIYQLAETHLGVQRDEIAFVSSNC
jgi:2-haloacid dehalogenase